MIMMISVIALLCLGVASCQGDLYPYGSPVGDSSLSLCDDCSSSPISTDHVIQIGGGEYNRFWINANGHVSFHGPVSNYRPLRLPMTSNSWKTVAPFWADVDLRRTNVAPEARIYHRQTVDQDILNRAKDEIRAEFSDDFYLYSPVWAYVVTWYKVTYYGSPNLGGPLKNTFQVVIVTDGDTSFAIFNYDDMSWSRGTASGGIHAVAGFDANDGHHAMIPESLTSSMASLSGSRMFKIGGEDSIPSPCHTETGRQLRLVQGRYGSVMEGYAQIKVDGTWYSICNKGWDHVDAEVFCTQLGYPGEARRIRNTAEEFGALSQVLPFKYSRVNCVEGEQCLSSCTLRPPRNCASGDEAGVICHSSQGSDKPIRLAGGYDESQGNVEIEMGGQWRKVCDVGWDINEANLLCAGEGFAGGIPTRNSFFESTDGLEFGITRFRCDESVHETIFACPSDVDIDIDESTCGDNDAAGVICYNAEQEIRLVQSSGDTTDSGEGNVEFKVGSQYRRVCDTRFGEDEARLVCDHLDLGTEGVEVFHDAHFGDTNSDLPFFHFRCEGDEEKLFDCLKPLNGDVCEGGAVAGVRCPPAP